MIRKVKHLDDLPSISHLPSHAQKLVLDLMWDAIGKKFKNVKGNKRLRTRWKVFCQSYHMGSLKSNLKQPTMQEY